MEIGKFGIGVLVSRRWCTRQKCRSLNSLIFHGLLLFSNLILNPWCSFPSRWLLLLILFYGNRYHKVRLTCSFTEFMYILMSGLFAFLLLIPFFSFYQCLFFVVVVGYCQFVLKDRGTNKYIIYNFPSR